MNFGGRGGGGGEEIAGEVPQELALKFVVSELLTAGRARAVPDTKSWSIFWGAVGHFVEGRKSAGMGQHGAESWEFPLRGPSSLAWIETGKEMPVGINTVLKH